MYALNKFFDGEFYTYGLEVIRFAQMDSEMRIDPMIKIFPRMTKCQFYRYGPSSNIETVDALCLLPIVSAFESKVLIQLSTMPLPNKVRSFIKLLTKVSLHPQNIINEKVTIFYLIRALSHLQSVSLDS